MEIEQNDDYAAPWGTRDIWLGMVSLAGWWIVFLISAFWVGPAALQENLGLAMGVWELALVIPAWWFAVRKYRVKGYGI